MNYNMNESLIKALDMCRVYIGAKRNVTDEDIESAISKILLLFPEVDKASLKDELLALYNVKVEAFQILEGKDRRVPWLKAFRAAKKSQWKFWTRYSKYLKESKRFALM